jgi:ribosomal protein L6P/L9E
MTFNFQLSKVIDIEYTFHSYLVIRAGHIQDMYLGLFNNMLGYITKKDRKLILIANNKENINYLGTFVTAYRKPSVYTGRGLRIKKIIVIRKAGKKDKQKGKAF